MSKIYSVWTWVKYIPWLNDWLNNLISYTVIRCKTRQNMCRHSLPHGYKILQNSNYLLLGICKMQAYCTSRLSVWYSGAAATIRGRLLYYKPSFRGAASIQGRLILLEEWDDIDTEATIHENQTMEPDRLEDVIYDTIKGVPVHSPALPFI